MPKKNNEKVKSSKITDVSAKDVCSAKFVDILRFDVEEDYTDDDPITPEEERDLMIGMNQFRNGRYKIIPSSYTREEFFEVLRGERDV